MKFAYSFFLIFVVLKQFYIFDSGTLQPGDLFLFVSFFFYMTSNKQGFIIKKIDKLLMVFLVFVFIINGIYFVLYNDNDFLLATLYYMFNFLIVILFREYSESNLFVSKFILIIKFNIITQFFIYLFKVGRWYGSIRYMGTFNDPNQMAFFIFTSLLLLFISSKIVKKKINIFYYLSSTFLIFKTASTGMLLAIISFYIIMLFHYFYISISTLKLKLSKKYFLIISAFVFIMIIMSITGKIDLLTIRNNNLIIERVEEKLHKSFNAVSSDQSNYKNMSIIEERGIDKLILYPEKLFYGAGQGNYIRFIDTAHYGEIHSTLPSILFCYGIVPFIILMMWFQKNIGKLNPLNITIFIPLLLESFTLLNQRQPFFWMIFVLYRALEVKNTTERL